MTSNAEVVVPNVAVGESVMYAAYSGSDAELDGKRYKVVYETDCLAKW